MPYIDLGYIDSGYYEGDEVVPIEPSDTIVNINRSFVLDGEDISSKVATASLSKINGRAYHTLTLTINDYDLDRSVIRNKNIRLVCTIGTDVYSCIIIDADVDYMNNITIVAKTQGCLLDSPFSPIYESELIIGNSRDIIDTMCSNIEYYNGIPDFEFNKGSFTLTGTALDAIEKLVAVAGGTIYDKEGKLYIMPHFRIQEGSTAKFIFNDRILHDKILTDNTDGSNLVNSVVFNSEYSDIYSVPKITMIIKETCDRPYFLLNPTPSSVSDINSNLGAIKFISTSQTYEATLLNENVVEVGGGIERISKVTLDGVTINASEYEYEEGHNMIVFYEKLDGALVVMYYTQAIRYYTSNGDYSSSDNTRTYKVQYLNQVLEQTISNCDDSSSDGEVEIDDPDNPEADYTVPCFCRILDDLKKDTPLQIVVNSDVSKFIFVSDATGDLTAIYPTVDTSTEFYALGDFENSFIESAVATEITTTESSSFTFELIYEENSQVVGFFTEFEMSNFLVGSSSVDLLRGSTNGAHYYYIRDNSYLGLSVSSNYTANATLWTFNACGSDNKVKTVDVYSCGGLTTFTYPQSNSDDPTETDVCTVPATIDLNVSLLLGIPSSECAGKEIFDNMGQYNGYVVPANGIIAYNIVTNALHTINCSAIRSGSEILVDASNATVGDAP